MAKAENILENCCVAIRMKEWLLFIKIYTSLFLSKEVKASVECERQRQKETEGDK